MNDYDGVADWYDEYVSTDRDIRFFQELAGGASRILDLMAGTGRVSIPMAQVGSGSVVCVDLSPRMLVRLKRKAARLDRVQAVCGDVARLPLRASFDLVTMPFNSLAELTDPIERTRLIERVGSLLSPGGRFVCTLHDPAVRRRTLDGVPHGMGPFSLPDGSSLELTATGNVEEGSSLATSVQRYRHIGVDGRLLVERTQTVRFALVEKDEVETAARGAGLSIPGAMGDYDGRPHEPGAGPFMIWLFTKRA